MSEAKILLTLVQRHFGFLQDAGFEVVRSETVTPAAFQGGFILEYRRNEEAVVIAWLVLEIEITRNGKELFGSTIHPGFAGNMFTDAHLREHLPRIAKVIKERFAT